jgi:hypothetical protein
MVTGTPFAMSHGASYSRPTHELNEICREVFAHHGYYSAEKLLRDVPEFRPAVSLAEGMRQVIDDLDRAGRLPSPALEDWEDRIIAAQRHSQGRAGRR